jgi:hypothetical protein
MFGVFKTYRDIKKGIKDPGALGQELALDAIKAPVIISTIIAVLFFAGLFILSFTELLGGSFLFFKIVFWILLVPTLIIEFVIWTVIGNLRRVIEKTRMSMKKEGIMEAEVIDSK